MNSATNNKTDLLPCPFCGAPGTCELGNCYEENYRFQCLDCHATTGRYRTRQEAHDAWNNRDPSTKSTAALKCKCIKGIGLNGGELGIVEDCPIHGDGTPYRPDITEIPDGEAD